MKCQEHNRSSEGILREKNQDPTSMTVPQEKDDICNRRQITLQGTFLHYGVHSLKKKTGIPLSVFFFGHMVQRLVTEVKSES